MKLVLVFLAAVHVGLISVAYAPDVNTCTALASTQSKPQPQDAATALHRASYADTFNVATALEVIALVLLPFFPSERLLPSLLLVDVIAIRARHLGWGSCSPNDTRCCSALNCFNFDNCQQPPFIEATTNWNDRRNYCPMPHFYVKDSKAKSACKYLSNTPDMASCYRYGCSKTHTPFQYWIQRSTVLSLVLISVIGLFI